MERQHYKFELTPLPYAYDALEPYIDAKTMQLHHNRHLKSYVDNLNAALRDYPEYHSWSLERLLTSANFLPEAIRAPVKNNAGGVYNHELFFAGMTGNRDIAPSAALAERIDQTFGSWDGFKSEFKSQALAVFGSGYAWLALDRNGALRIVKTANQDTLLPLGMCPIMLIDVWEHAYYLKHYNLRGDYIDDWFNVVNLEMASRSYEKCLSNS